jgi:hypothetical protein
MSRAVPRVRVQQDKVVNMDHPMVMSPECHRCNGMQWLLASQESSLVLSLPYYNLHMLPVHGQLGLNSSSSLIIIPIDIGR